MTETAHDGDDGMHDGGRYGQFSSGDATVVYDRQNADCWLESDTLLALADMR